MSCRQVLIAVAVAVSVATVAPGEGSSTSYDPFTPDLGPCLEEMNTGEAAHLFYSGTEEMRRSVRIGDVLSRSARGPARAGRVRGSFRIVSFQGKTCLRGEVLEGTVRVHDRLERDGAYFLVVPGDVCSP